MKLPNIEFFADHFPDGVDICVMSGPHIQEIAVIGLDPFPEFEIRHYEMEEVEPETDIWAVMSPITHRIYVYVDPVIWLESD